MASRKQGEPQNVWHPIKNHRACKEAEIHDPELGEKNNQPILPRKRVVLPRSRHIDQSNRIETSEINPCFYGQLIYNKGHKSTQ